MDCAYTVWIEHVDIEPIAAESEQRSKACWEILRTSLLWSIICRSFEAEPITRAIGALIARIHLEVPRRDIVETYCPDLEFGDNTST